MTLYLSFWRHILKILASSKIHQNQRFSGIKSFGIFFKAMYDAYIDKRIILCLETLFVSDTVENYLFSDNSMMYSIRVCFFLGLFLSNCISLYLPNFFAVLDQQSQYSSR